jgi:hypothetical protein
MRTQGPNDPQLLNYATHQRLLMPLLARCYAVMAVARRCTTKYQSMVDVRLSCVLI